MASWTDIDVNSLLPGQPFTSSIALAYEENPRALAEQASGAPKIADKTAWASGTTITFSSLDDYAGVFIFGSAQGSTSGTSGNVDLNISWSDDGGSSFGGNVDFVEASIGGAGSLWVSNFSLFFDFASGRVRASGVVLGGTDPGPGDIVGQSKIISGASLDITDVRLSGATNFRALAIPQGGESAS